MKVALLAYNKNGQALLKKVLFERLLIHKL